MELSTERLFDLLDGAEGSADLLAATIVQEVERIAGTTDPSFSILEGANCGDIGTGTYVGHDIVDAVLAGICRTIAGVGDSIGVLLGDTATLMAQFFQDTMSRILQDVEASIGTLVNRLEFLLDSITQGFATLVDDLVQQVSAVAQQMAATVSQIVSQLVGHIDEVVGRVVDSLSQILHRLQFVLEDVFFAVGAKVNEIIDVVGGTFDALLNAAQNVIRAVGEGVAGVAGKVIDAARAVVAQIGESISNLVDGLANAADGALSRIQTAVGDVAGALREVGEGVVSGLVEGVGGPVAAVGVHVIEAVVAYAHKVLDDAQATFEGLLGKLLTNFGVPPQGVERITRMFTGAVPEGQLAVLASIVGLLPILAVSAGHAAMTPVLAQITQEVNQLVRPALIPVADALEAHRRGVIQDDELESQLSQAGFDSRAIDVLISVGLQQMPIGELVHWWLRGFIDEDLLNLLFARQGISPTDGANIKAGAFFLPPIPDLIRMAVREVFTPEIRQTFGLDEGFPERFAEIAAQQGVAPEWAQAYWAGHWELPSVFQGFEMLHRRVIDEDELGLLLRAHDVMPFWREKLTAISHHPLTRVDVRRMHSLGLLTDEDLIDRYMDVGFARPEAEMMAAFTVAYNAPPAAEDPNELAGLTRASILNMFEDGIFSRAQAAEALIGLGNSEDATELYLVQRELEMQREARQAETDLILDSAVSGAISFDEAQDRLAAIGLEAAELGKALNKLVREQSKRNRLPSVEQLSKMRAAGIIRDSEYLETLGRHGYSLLWAGRLLELEETGA